MPRGWQALSQWAFAAYLAALALVVLLPAQEAQHVTGFVGVIADFLSTWGFPRRGAEMAVEFSSNIVLFVPFGAFLRLLSPPRIPGWLLMAGGTVTSTAIELIQLVVPGRVTALSDVIANTAGTIVGVLLIALLRRWNDHRSLQGAVRRPSQSRS
ncbi:VanZ family protein [Arthrobacter sp. NPDC090010]|uniref:VanZ family protein n=1 Tax=Arthrobacter sp. NPDC090010 TaxID=3363942 RepID=UPI0038036DC1